MSGTIKNWTKKVILAKFEATEGTDSAPVVGTDAFQVLNYTPQFMDSDGKVRNLDRAFFGARPVGLSAIRRGATFSMEIAGGGTATTPPPWMKMNEICGFGAGVVTTFVLQSPITDNIKSLTHWAYIDDLLTKMVGARGSVGFRFEDDEFPVFNYRLLGIAPSSLATTSVPGTPTITGYTTPLLVSTENTTFTFDGFAAPLRRWEMDANAELNFRSLVGPSDRIQYGDRNWNGTMVIRIPDLATKDYFANIRPGTTMVANLIHGAAVGNTVTVNCPALQITGNVDITEEQNEAMATFPVSALPVSGNDEITFKTA
jgi:hypothetical protein